MLDDGVITRATRPPNRFLVPARASALSLFLSSLVTARTWGIGDFSALGEVSRRAHELGFKYIALGPITATPYSGDVSPSPYSPTSRLWFNVCHVDVERVPGWQDEADPVTTAQVRALRAGNLVQPTLARDTKLRALRRIFASYSYRYPADFEEFMSRGDRHLHEFALFASLSAKHGNVWQRWPQDVRLGPSKFAAERAQSDEHARFVMWCQWLAEVQLAEAAAAGCDLILDLPIATPHDSADAWTWQSVTALTVDLGAPPDYIDPAVSRWPLAPFVPERLAEIGFSPWRAALHAHFTYGRGLRFDHAYGLFRQFWLRHAHGEGSFVSQPTQAMLDVLAETAARRNSWVATEELGLSPDGAEEVFRSERLVVQRPFVTDQFDPTRAEAWVSISSHDLPTLRALADPESQHPDWILNPAFFDRARARIAGIAPGITSLSADRLAEAALTAIDEAFDPLILSCAVDDITAEPRPYNLPGTDGSRYPNFLRKYPTLDSVTESKSWAALAGLLHDRTSR